MTNDDAMDAESQTVEIVTELHQRRSPMTSALAAPPSSSKGAAPIRRVRSASRTFSARPPPLSESWSQTFGTRTPSIRQGMRAAVLTVSRLMRAAEGWLSRVPRGGRYCQRPRHDGTPRRLPRCMGHGAGDLSRRSFKAAGRASSV